MKLQNGFKYVTRGGQTVGPLHVPPKESVWTACVVADGHLDGTLQGWCSGGAYLSDREPDDLDLVAEAPGNPVVVTVSIPGWLHIDGVVYPLPCTSGAVPVTVTFETRDGVPDPLTYKTTPRAVELTA